MSQQTRFSTLGLVGGGMASRIILDFLLAVCLTILSKPISPPRARYRLPNGVLNFHVIFSSTISSTAHGSRRDSLKRNPRYEIFGENMISPQAMNFSSSVGLCARMLVPDRVGAVGIGRSTKIYAVISSSSGSSKTS